MRVEYPYAQDGHDVEGAKLPDIPIIWLEVEVAGAK